MSSERMQKVSPNAEGQKSHFFILKKLETGRRTRPAGGWAHLATRDSAPPGRCFTRLSALLSSSRHPLTSLGPVFKAPTFPQRGQSRKRGKG